jgi:hypothetical protein
MASTRIEDLPDNSDEGGFIRENDFSEEIGTFIKEIVPEKTQLIFDFNLIKDTIFVLILMLFSSNNDVQKWISRFPGLKLQRSDIYFSILISILFTIIFALVKFFLL